MNNNDFVLGINYWPASKAMYWWKNWEAEEVETDFKRIAESGFNKVRIFLLWEDFQPQINKILLQSIDYLSRTLDIAKKNNIGIMPTFFTGHMSGVNWMPEWMLTSEDCNSRFEVFSGGELSKRVIKNFYEDKEIQDAQVYQITEIAKLLKGHSALWAWDLGNESSNCVIPESKEQGLVWLKKMVNALKTIDNDKPVSIGLHMKDLEEDRNLGLVEAGKYCDFVCMHGYPSYCKWAEGNLDTNLIPFLARVAGWLAQKPVVFQEFGLAVCANFKSNIEDDSIIVKSEKEAEKYYVKVLEEIYDVGCIGAFSWCYSDYRAKLWAFPPLDKAIHERFFGLWKYSGEEKSMIRAVREFGKRTVKQMDWEPEISREDFYKVGIERLYKSH